MSENLPRLTPAEWTELFRIARGSIAHGLEEQEPLAIDLQKYSGVMREPTATFVTLRIQGELRGMQGELRGCMGNLTADRPLVEDVAENAFAAAFRDPRFPPLLEMEFRKVHIHLSLLGPPEPISFTSEEDLLRQIQPGLDGLILKARGQRGTFLPSVWEMLPSKEEFWKALKRKARLPENYWGEDVRVDRYRTLSADEADFRT